ncbi:MAG: hypothetical protein AB7G48_10865 [Nitrospiraceae bacterium]
MTHSLHPRRARMIMTLLMLLAVTFTGCSRWMQINGAAPTDLPPAAHTAGEPGSIPAVITGIVVTQNGTRQAATPDLERRVLDRLAKTELFGRLLYPAYAEDAPSREHVRATLTVEAHSDPHAGGAAFKGIVIGASMFLLTPLLPLEYDYGTLMTLELARPDGTSHLYQAQAQGTAYYHLFGATPLAIEELRDEVIEHCLVQLQRELVKDREFVQAAYVAKRQTESTGAPVVQTGTPILKAKPTLSIIRQTGR